MWAGLVPPAHSRSPIWGRWTPGSGARRSLLAAAASRYAGRRVKSMRLAWRRRKWSGATLGVGGALVLAACGNVKGMDPGDPARGPGQLVGNGDPITDGNFAGGNDVMPAPRDVVPPGPGDAIDCDAE